jgi:hypothetical protein
LQKVKIIYEVERREANSPIPNKSRRRLFPAIALASQG